jgi:hypothetical protein
MLKKATKKEPEPVKVPALTPLSGKFPITKIQIPIEEGLGFVV